MSTGQNVIVKLPAETVELIIAQQAHSAERLESVIARHFKKAGTVTPAKIKPAPQPKPPALTGHQPLRATGRYTGEVLGKPIGAETLPEFLAGVIDAVHAVAPEAIVRFADMRARSRAYVSRNAKGVHAGRTDLPTRRTLSGWYISENIGKKDLHRTLWALCEAADLNCGSDVRMD